MNRYHTIQIRSLTICVIILQMFAISCSQGEKNQKLFADKIIFNGSIYTVDEANSTVEAVVVKADTILYAGTWEIAESFKGDSTEMVDLNGNTMTPGFVEGHAHLMGVGYNLINVDLMEAQSYAEVIDMVKERASSTPKGQWILGRGWHQDKWGNKPERMFRNLPTHHDLSVAVPDHPVYLSHASGHMALANAKAMALAGINLETEQPDGGEIFMGMDGPTGIFNETAQGNIRKVIPATTKENASQALKLAIDECLKYGITSFQDAGSGRVVELFKEFGEQDKLKIRLYVMLRGDLELMNEYFEKGPDIGLYDDHLTIRAVKMASDGALGSRGAWLIEEYSDASGEFGHQVQPMTHIDSLTQEAYKAGFQVCVHAIGDRANKEVLDLYERTFEANLQEDPRFRIEHAQHMRAEDIPRFAELGVIPTMQAIHMASDRPWAIDRLGKQRIEEGAYMWQALLQSGARIVNGTDAPVEPLDPIPSFYASVSRKTLKGTPEEGYEPDQKMTREQALRSYTLDAAYGAFMEDIIGSIEVGKYADFTVFDKNIMTIPEGEILDTKVAMTIIGGEVVYEAE
ncbi:amidohydrolase family protein [Ekhidna sp.]|uniref:amidohydrolase n=1 Tax=Ekhidna sp. TaxID=2608089 RepID=UPI0032EE243F